ncbi:MAG TPA: hypothetical protein VIH48_04180 [Candidatus Bathyarchaeia archaeon]
MKSLPKEFDIIEIEKKWEDMGIYRFDWKDKKRPTFSIFFLAISFFSVRTAKKQNGSI